MLRNRPSVALGFSLLVLNLASAVLPDAVHAWEHRQTRAHADAIVHEHDGAEHDGAATDLDTHEHVDVRATCTPTHPDLVALPVAHVAEPTIRTNITGPIQREVERDPYSLTRTHDPPSAPRAPPSR
jgi:hypothetical protein